RVGRPRPPTGRTTHFLLGPFGLARGCDVEVLRTRASDGEYGGPVLRCLPGRAGPASDPPVLVADRRALRARGHHTTGRGAACGDRRDRGRGSTWISCPGAAGPSRRSLRWW